MDLSAPEIIAAVSILAITSLVATNSTIAVPSAITSPLVGVFLVIVGLGCFSHSPVIGISILLLVAVLFFKNNIATATVRSPTTQYADVIVPDQSMGAATEYSSTQSEPRSYAQFNDTDPMNRMYGNVEGFVSPVAEGEPVDGQYPKESPRFEAPTVSSEFVYRPAEDTGSNEFQRYGPDLDEKKKAITYYQ